MTLRTGAGDLCSDVARSEEVERDVWIVGEVEVELWAKFASSSSVLGSSEWPTYPCTLLCALETSSSPECVDMLEEEACVLVCAWYPFNFRSVFEKRVECVECVEWVDCVEEAVDRGVSGEEESLGVAGDTVGWFRWLSGDRVGSGCGMMAPLGNRVYPLEGEGGVPKGGAGGGEMCKALGMGLVVLVGWWGEMDMVPNVSGGEGATAGRMDRPATVEVGLWW